MRYSLHFDDELVGHVEDGFISDGITYGRFVPTLHGEESVVRSDVQDFIEFCKSWHDRLADADCDPDASEFDAFREFTSMNRWFAAQIDSEDRRTAVHPPVFLRSGEVSFRIE